MSKKYLTLVISSNRKEGNMAFMEYVVAKMGTGTAMLIAFFGILLMWKIFDRISFRKSEREEREWKSRQDKEKDE